MRYAVLSDIHGNLEALNAVLLPVTATGLIILSGDTVSWRVGLAMAACMLLLFVGVAAWRMELADIRGDARFGVKVLPWLARAKAPTALLVGLSIPGAAYEVWSDGAWTPSAIAAVVFAALEYVNYYIVQLQHFDHIADLKRLLAGRGFREAHLAKALRRWRTL